MGLNICTSTLVSRGLITLEEKRNRDRCFWSVFVQDTLLSLYVGRAPSLTDADHNLTLPSPEQSRSSGETLNDADVSLCAMATLSDLLARVMKLLYSVHRDQPADPQLVARLRKERDDWPKTLEPPWTVATMASSPRPLALMLHATHSTAVILLNRPFLLRKRVDGLEGHLCLEAAMQTARMAMIYDDAFGIRRANLTMSQNMYVAASVLLILTTASGDDAPLTAEMQFTEAALTDIIKLLKELSSSWNIAGQSHQAIERTRGDHEHPAGRTRDHALAGGAEAEPTMERWLRESGLAWPTLEELFQQQAFDASDSYIWDVPD